MKTIQLLFFIFFGAIVSGINDIGIEYTVNKFMNSSDGGIILASFIVRMLLLAVIFYIATAGNFLGAASFMTGVVLQRIWFMFKTNFGKRLRV
ncbi:MAG: hypothetical protein LBP39_00585 [Rickettsiales bacterium]|jgi:hypothetical protein|nr:hypothetical protein [Rickettsiales bacterium]